MPNHSTYSFEDLAVTVRNPALGQLLLQGAGLGNITFAYATDISQNDLAADGSVMTSKIKASNGTVTITVQQTSDAAKWLRRLINYLKAAPSNEFTSTSLVGESKVMGITHSATGMSPQKMPDHGYQQAGQQISFAFLAQHIETR